MKFLVGLLIVINTSAFAAPKLELWKDILTGGVSSEGEVDYVWMGQLLKELNLTHGCNWKSLFIIVHLDHFKRIKFVWISFILRLNVLEFLTIDTGFEHFTECTLTNARLICENLGRSKLQVISRDPVMLSGQFGFQNVSTSIF